MAITRLFLDDMRDPPADGGDWVVVRSTTEAVAWCEAHGCPDVIAFDHDLGTADTGMRFAKWLVEQDLEAGGAFIPQGFTFSVHSMNPVGRLNIQGLLEGYLERRQTQARPTARPRP